MIHLGISPHIAVATNRIGVVGLGLTGYVAFQEQRLIRHGLAWAVGIACGLGAIAGAVVFMTLSELSLRYFIALASAFLLLITAFQKDLGVVSKSDPSKYRWAVGIPLSMTLGAYGSVYGAGFGTLITYMLVLNFGQSFLESAATRKVAEGLQAIVSSILYIRAGLIDWPMAINLFIGMGVGSYFGAKYGSKIGNVWLRRAFLILAAVLSAQLFFPES